MARDRDREMKSRRDGDRMAMEEQGSLSYAGIG